ncbi:MAG: polyamine aminopropyltransferase [Chitinispirillaceae bacterium]|jgi:spermidine synthase|nr:polyamine aminopropyltransferase [Chitinispirillaceae bacterium]
MNKMVSYPGGVGTSLWINNLVHGLSGNTIKVKHTVFADASPFQKIEVFDTYRYGLVLCLGGSIVMAEQDADIYHEMIVHPAMLSHKSPKKVCVIGGGDGGCLKEVRKYDGVESIVLVDIDAMVKETVTKYFPKLAKGFKDKRASVTIDDGYNFMKTTKERFDVIIVDSYDPGGPVQSLETADFHHIVAQRLNPDGIAVFQTDSPIVRPDYLRQTITLISPRFAQVKPYLCSFSSFPEGICGFLLCGREKNSLDRFDAARYKAIADGCAYYNSDIHTGAFLLPEYFKRIVREAGKR